MSCGRFLALICSLVNCLEMQLVKFTIIRPARNDDPELLLKWFVKMRKTNTCAWKMSLFFGDK